MAAGGRRAVGTTTIAAGIVEEGQASMEEQMVVESNCWIDYVSLTSC